MKSWVTAFRCGSGLVVTIPARYVRALRLRAGSRLGIVLDGAGRIVLRAGHGELGGVRRGEKSRKE